MGLVAVGAIVVLLIAAPVTASLYQAYDGVGDPPPYYPTGGSGVTVFRNAWAAQSFVATANYTLARVDLWAMADSPSGSSATLVVTSDSAGSPNMAGEPLANATATAPNSFGWVSFNVAPNVPLVQGAPYWLVVENNGTSGSQGWTWWNTGNESVIPDGAGELSPGGGSSWSPAFGDFDVRTFGYMETSIAVAATVSSVTAPAGGTVDVTVWFNNTGTAPAARVWINDTLPAGMAYASDNASASDGVRGSGASWAFTNLGPGVHYFVLSLSVDAGLANHSFLVNRLALNYSDFRGVGRPGSRATLTVTVAGSVVGPAWSNPPFLAALVFLLGSCIALFVLWPRGKIDQVFLVDHGGTLIAHLSDSEPERDNDIFVAMLTAVRDFVKDSFTETQSDLRRMDVGSRKIFLRRGRYSYLAVVVKGRTPPTLRRRMARTLSRIETTYEEILAHWHGEVETMAGSEDVLSAGLLG